MAKKRGEEMNRETGGQKAGRGGGYDELGCTPLQVVANSVVYCDDRKRTSCCRQSH